MSKRWMGMAAVLVAMGMPSVASADVRTGSQVDPADDATAATSLNSDNSTRLLDVRAVRVSDDPQKGSLEIAFDGQLTGIGHSTLWLHAELSEISSNGCTGAQDRAFVVDGWESGRSYSSAVPTARLLDSHGALVATGVYEDASQTGTGPRMTFVTSELAGRDLRCVDGISASKATSGYAFPSRDDVDSFCLGGCSVFPPAAASSTPASTPTPTPIDAPTDQAPAAPSAPVPASGVTVVTGHGESTTPAPALTLPAVRVAVGRALTARLSTTFERHAAGSYRLRCELAAANATCQVSWRVKGSRYAGTVALTSRLVGGTASVEVTRLAVHRV